MQKIKQPAPSVALGVSEVTNDGKKYKIIQPPKVGTLQPPKMSATPISDWLEIKRKENPHIIYKITPKNNKIDFFNTFASLGIIACAIGSIAKLIKK